MPSFKDKGEYVNNEESILKKDSKFSGIQRQNGSNEVNFFWGGNSKFKRYIPRCFKYGLKDHY